MSDMYPIKQQCYPISDLYPLFCCVETQKGIYEAILIGEIDVESPPWPSISACAKDLVRRMLARDPYKRPTSDQVLRKLPSKALIPNFSNFSENKIIIMIICVLNA